MNIFSCRFFVSLVWYLTHDDVAVCRGGGGDFGRRFCQLPPPPSYPCHDSVEEWRRVFQIQDPWYLLQRSLKIFNCIVSIIYIHVHQYHKWHVDNTNNHQIYIYVVHVLFFYFNCDVKMKCMLAYNATKDFISIYEWIVTLNLEILSNNNILY